MRYMSPITNIMHTSANRRSMLDEDLSGPVCGTAKCETTLNVKTDKCEKPNNAKCEKVTLNVKKLR